MVTDGSIQCFRDILIQHEGEKIAVELVAKNQASVDNIVYTDMSAIISCVVT